jgi:hypothetical protein
MIEYDIAELKRAVRKLENEKPLNLFTRDIEEVFKTIIKPSVLKELKDTFGGDIEALKQKQEILRRDLTNVTSTMYSRTKRMYDELKAAQSPLSNLQSPAEDSVKYVECGTMITDTDKNIWFFLTDFNIPESFQKNPQYTIQPIYKRIDNS